MKTFISRAAILLVPMLVQLQVKAGDVVKPNKTETITPDKPEDPTPTGINELSVKTFHAYPVPSSGNLSVKVDISEINKHELVVFDILGKEIQRVRCENEITQFSNLKSGMYFLSLQSGTSAKTLKFIVN